MGDARRFERFIREDEDIEYFTGESAGSDADAFIAEVDAMRVSYSQLNEWYVKEHEAAVSANAQLIAMILERMEHQDTINDLLKKLKNEVSGLAKQVNEGTGRME